MKSNIFALAVVILVMSSCDDATDPQSSPVNQPNPVDGNPPSGEVLKRGVFNGYEHNLKGSAVLYVDSLDMKSIHLEEFTMTQGPDVRVYLSRSNNYSNANTIEVARLKAGYVSQRIEIPVTQYMEEYKFVLIYCIEFHSLFGYAELR